MRALALHRLVPGRHLRRRVEVEVALVDQPLHEIVEQLGELRLRLLVAVAAQRLEHLGRELAALHQRFEDRLPQRVERAVARLVEAHAVVRAALAAGEAGLEQEVGELVEQRLEIDRVGHLRRELAVGVKAHGEPPAFSDTAADGARVPSSRGSILSLVPAANLAQSVPRRPPAPELPPVPRSARRCR